MVELLHAFRVEVSRRGERLGKLVGKAGLDSLAACHPGFLLEEGFDFVSAFACLAGVSHDHGVFNFVEQLDVAPHIVSIATGDTPRFVHHHQRVFRDMNHIASHQNDSGHGCRQPVNVTLNAGWVMLE